MIFRAFGAIFCMDGNADLRWYSVRAVYYSLVVTYGEIILMSDEKSHILAADPATPTEMLAELARDPALAPIVAANPVAPGDLLEMLVQGQDEVVRRAVAGNPNAPVHILQSSP